MLGKRSKYEADLDWVQAQVSQIEELNDQEIKIVLPVE